MHFPHSRPTGNTWRNPFNEVTWYFLTAFLICLSVMASQRQTYIFFNLCKLYTHTLNKNDSYFNCHYGLFTPPSVYAVNPPSTRYDDPVTKEAASLARKATTLATSSGVPNLFIG